MSGVRKTAIPEHAKIAILEERLRLKEEFATWDKEKMTNAMRKIQEIAIQNGVVYNDDQYRLGNNRVFHEIWGHPRGHLRDILGTS